MSLLSRRLRVCCRFSLLLLLPGCVLVTGKFDPFGATPEPLEEHVVSGDGDAKILLLDISRVIGSQVEEGAFGMQRRASTTARVREELQRASKDRKLRAVLLRINSPGGSVTASDVIFHQLMQFKRERGIPVVAHLLDFATSGAYYVALAADEIVASPTTVTGSIGVVLYGLNLTGLMDKVGIKNQTVKSGEKKDIGSPLRPMTPDEQRILRTVLDGMQDRFLSLASERRPGLTAARLETIADGRILTATQALEAGLVDRIGYLPDAVAVATERAGESQARVVMYRRPQEFAENIYSHFPAGPMHFSLINFDFAGLMRPVPQFMYLWLPSGE